MKRKNRACLTIPMRFVLAFLPACSGHPQTEEPTTNNDNAIKCSGPVNNKKGKTECKGGILPNPGVTLPLNETEVKTLILHSCDATAENMTITQANDNFEGKWGNSSTNTPPGSPQSTGHAYSSTVSVERNTIKVDCFSYGY